MTHTPEDIAELLGLCTDYAVAGKTWFPARFSRPYDAIHYKMLDFIKHPERHARQQGTDPRYQVIVSSRGIGKTSFFNLLLPAHRALYLDSRYIVPVSATGTLAQQQSENLKRSLTRNPVITEMFGDLKTDSFSKEQWVIRVGGEEGEEVCVMPRGAGQQVRGLLWGDYRPDLILVDDLENTKGVKTDLRREDMEEWFFGDLLNCVDRGSNDWRIVVIGTILHQNSLLMKLLESDYWTKLNLPICNDELESNAPNFIPTEEVRRIYKMFKDEGRLSTFYREYMNKPVAGGEDAQFQQGFIKYYSESAYVVEHNTSLNNDVKVENFLLLDPSRTANPASKPTGLMAVAVNMYTNAIYIREAVQKKWHQDEMFDEIVAMALRNNAKAIGVEVTGLHEFITYPLKTFLSQKSLSHIEVIELHARGGMNEAGKVSRAKELLPFYRRGLVYHNETGCETYESNLMAFPMPSEWALVDCAAYIIEMLERGQRYLAPSDTEYDVLSPSDDEYAELELEPDQDYLII